MRLASETRIGIKGERMDANTRIFRAYAQWTPTTSIHKTDQDAITCSILGIGGEWGECMDIIEKTLFSENDTDMHKELGDVFYYMGLIAVKMGFLDRTRVDREKGSPYSIMQRIFRIQEHYKKMIRDNEGKLSGYAKEHEFVELFNTILSSLLREVEHFEQDFSTILNMNQDKLTSRLERGVVHGSGNDR